jgi:hypothetical protein
VTDVIFAVDSIPAIFAITSDPFIVLTSNVFAVLGLRAMFFLLAGMADRFHLLPYGLAVVLGLHRQQDAAGRCVQDPDRAVAGHRGRDHRHHHRPEPAASAAAGTLTARSVPSMQAPPTRAVLAFERSRPSSMACPRH